MPKQYKKFNVTNDNGQWIAYRTSSPMFCFVDKEEDKVRKTAIAALEAYKRFKT